MPTVTLVIDVDGMITTRSGEAFLKHFAPNRLTQDNPEYLIGLLRRGQMKDLLLNGVVATLEALLDEEFSQSINAKVKVIFNSNNHKEFIGQLLIEGGLSIKTFGKLSIYGRMENAYLGGEDPKITRFDRVIGREFGDKNFVMDA